MLWLEVGIRFIVFMLNVGNIREKLKLVRVVLVRLI